MGLNSTPNAERVHIGIFGKRNAGKSSVINAITGQDLAVVSDVSGTTTDPVQKAMELLPLGPVLMIDTPGLDDVGELGALRVRKSYQVLNKTDIAVLVTDGPAGISREDQAILDRIRKKEIPYVLVLNKADLVPGHPDLSDPFFADSIEKTAAKTGVSPQNIIWVSAAQKWHIWELKELIAAQYREPAEKLRLVGDLLEPADIAVLVIPIDKAAPKGRLILPQQQTIRDILDANASAVMCKENELSGILESLNKKPKIVITDSQVFPKADADTPDDIWMTSFSVLMARFKGDLEELVRGVTELDRLRDGDTILISEGCTHHRQCDDIGTVKIPRWIRNYSGADLQFAFTSGVEFPDDLSAYRMIVHCGGCMLNRREMQYRIRCARDAGVPITNYGVLIAYINGILKRSLEPFPYALAAYNAGTGRGKGTE